MLDLASDLPLTYLQDTTTSPPGGGRRISARYVLSRALISVSLRRPLTDTDITTASLNVSLKTIHPRPNTRYVFTLIPPGFAC